MIRSAWVALLASASLLVLGTLVILGAYLRFPRGFFDWAGRTWSRIILWSSGTPVRVIGAENVSRDRPQAIIANHQSMFDVFAIAANMPRRFHFVAKKELQRIPIFGRAGRAAGHVFIDRGNREAAIRSLQEANRRMREENSTAILFPEGTRSLTGDLQPFKKGPFVMALESGVEVVPTVLDGTLEILPKRGIRIRPRPITLRFGRPISPERYRDGGRDAFMVRVHAVMADMLAELRAPAGYEGPKFLEPAGPARAAADE